MDKQFYLLLWIDKNDFLNLPENSKFRFESNLNSKLGAWNCSG